MYILQNNVEVVAGANRYCIYNLNTKKMYSMDADDYSILRRILDSSQPDRLSCQNYIDYLLAEGIIAEPDHLLPPMQIPKYQFTADFVWIEITQNCNLICRHCYENSSRAKCTPEMSFENFKIVVDFLKRMGGDRIQLVGGEPLIHSQIETLILYAADRFSFVEIFTNGTLLTDSLLDIIQAHHIALALSVYSDNPLLHDSVTQIKGSYALTYKHIRQALSRGIQVRIASVEMKNIPRFQFKEPNVSQRYDLPRLTGRADLSLYTRDMLYRKLITRERFKRPIEPNVYFKNKVLHNCFGERLYIDCHLNVYPCAMERRVCYGNLAASGLDDGFKHQMASMTKDKIDGCRDCEYRYACFDCRCDSNNASIHAKPWYCTYDQERGVWIDPDTWMDHFVSQAESAF